MSIRGPNDLRKLLNLARQGLNVCEMIVSPPRWGAPLSGSVRPTSDVGISRYGVVGTSAPARTTASNSLAQMRRIAGHLQIGSLQTLIDEQRPSAFHCLLPSISRFRFVITLQFVSQRRHDAAGRLQVHRLDAVRKAIDPGRLQPHGRVERLPSAVG